MTVANLTPTIGSIIMSKCSKVDFEIMGILLLSRICPHLKTLSFEEFKVLF